VFVQPTSLGFASYELTAYNNFDSSKATVQIEVISGGGGTGNNNPVISFPSGNSHTIEAGQTLSFTVTATDADASDVITLSAGSLPANSTFATEVGSGTVSSTFSFTPDINQEGVFVAQFSAVDNQGGSFSASATITVEALAFDRLFTTSAEGQAPVGGLSGKAGINFPINIVTSQTVYGIQFDMLYDPDIVEVDSVVVTPRTPDYVVYDDIGGTPGQIRIVTFGLSNDSIITDTASTAVLNVVMTLDSLALPGDYPITIQDGWESVSPDFQVPSLEMFAEGGIIQVDRPGDVNLDKKIDVADLVNIVASIIGNYILPERQFESADVIRNDSVNVFDLVGTVNLIFGLPVSPTPAAPQTSQPAMVAFDYNELEPGQNDVMVVRSELPEEIAGVELDIKYDPYTVSLSAPERTADASGMAMQYRDDGQGNMKVLLHFTNPYNHGALLPAGDVDLVNIPIAANKKLEIGNKSQLRLGNALLATATAASVAVSGIDPELPVAFELFQNYPNPFNPETNIEFSVDGLADGSQMQDVRLDVFNILGQTVKTLIDQPMPPGKHHIVWDASSTDGQRVATGIYLYRLIVGQEYQTKKMLLLK
jgi:hypothetical protein